MTYLTYSCRLRMEHRAATTPRQQTLFWAAFFSWVHVIPAAFASLSTDLLHLCFGLHRVLMFQVPILVLALVVRRLVGELASRRLSPARVMVPPEEESSRPGSC
jgi:uncharacterized membrane protein